MARTSLWRVAIRDVFDQSSPFGRFALAHSVMSAGDTLVTISLAGSLFFSVSPHEATSRVLLYLLLTVAPFAVVSPALGPLVDRSPRWRRLLVTLSSAVRAVLCVVMATHLTSLWLFPLAFAVLVSSKLYAVTKGTLVPEMARAHQLGRLRDVDAAGWPTRTATSDGFAGFNAQLTLLSTLAGFVAGSLGAAVLHFFHAPHVLRLAAVVFALGTVAALRLRAGVAISSAPTTRTTAERENADRELTWALFVMALQRAGVGFATFLVAFALRRSHAGLAAYGVALGATGAGSLLGVSVVARFRPTGKEQRTLWRMGALAGVGVMGASALHGQLAHAAVVATVALSAAIVQPAFDALTQRFVPSGAQGRTFARFAVRQQLAWVVGAVIPVALSIPMSGGAIFLGVALLSGSLLYAIGRRPPKN